MDTRSLGCVIGSTIVVGLAAACSGSDGAHSTATPAAAVSATPPGATAAASASRPSATATLSPIGRQAFSGGHYQSRRVAWGRRIQ